MKQGLADTTAKYAANPQDVRGNTTMNQDYYERILDEVGAETIARYDREESGGQCFGTEEIDQDNGAFGFGALDRDKQTAILSAIDTNLPTRTTRPNTRTGTSYALKHMVERFTGFYVSNLQTKTAMRVLGYVRSADELNPVYNVTKREWRAFSDLSREVADRRSAARRRVAKREEQKAAARYFYDLGRARA